jgi:hypothetical protein
MWISPQGITFLIGVRDRLNDRRTTESQLDFLGVDDWRKDAIRKGAMSQCGWKSHSFNPLLMGKVR